MLVSVSCSRAHSCNPNTALSPPSILCPNVGIPSIDVRSCVAYRRDRDHGRRYEQSWVLLGSNRMLSWLPILFSSQALRQDTTFFFTEAIFVLQWARISDQIGRRPVLLFGVTGLTISATCFGLSSTFQGLILSRALAGVLNANFAVLRGAMAEILDPSNFARTIAWLPIMWSAGATIGSVDCADTWTICANISGISSPLVGGSLSHPYERLPTFFGDNKLWKRHPYLLPCLFSATVSASSFTLAFFFLKEVSYVSIYSGF